jgi:Na+/H+ antiporter NhaA
MAESQPAGRSWTGWSARSAGAEPPLRRFLRTETGSAAVLLGAAVAALVWVNIDQGSYDRVWATELSLRLGDWSISQELREWINSGLMTFFFFVVGLETRREFDMGELRERRRLALPLLAGLGGMLLPIGIYLAANAGRPSAHGWGAAMASDTAFALGMLALVGPRFPDRLRAFMLTVSVVDDFVSLAVIAAAYSARVEVMALLAALGVTAVLLALRALRVRVGLVYGLLGIAAWLAVHRSGIDPIVVGLGMGLLTYAYPAARDDLRRASDLFRLFREQPTPELARSASIGLSSAISPNERLAQLFHPWTSYLIVPVFALANAGIAIDGRFLVDAFTSPITLGILIGYVVGKPLGIVCTAALVTRVSRGRLRPPVGWAAVIGAGQIAGIGFTVSLLISSLAFTGVRLEQAKLGVLSAALASSLLTWLVFRATAALSPVRRFRALLGTAEVLVDLAAPVDPERDHVRGEPEALVTVVEYGDFECPYCGQAEPVVRELLAGHGDVRYVWRHLPLADVHPHAQLAAEAAEAASAQGRFWEMHDVLLEHQGELVLRDLLRYARELELDVELFRQHLRERYGAARVAEDVESADLSGVSGTPTFFINGRRHHGAYDIETLTAEVRAAKARAFIASSASP